jgi:hypothetical protein
MSDVRVPHLGQRGHDGGIGLDAVIFASQARIDERTPRRHWPRGIICQARKSALLSDRCTATTAVENACQHLRSHNRPPQLNPVSGPQVE